MAVPLDSSKLITIYGGSGFVGRHVVRALAETGCRMRIAVRRPDLAGHLQPMGGVGQIHAVQANVRDKDSVRRAAIGADAVINLVGILHQSGRQTFAKVHDEGAGRIAKAATASGARAMVQLSSIGADTKSPSLYARSKGAGEKAVLNSYPEASILRASLIFGPEDDFFNRFGAMARLSPMLPLIGGGETRFQPVYVGDVARAVVAAIEGKARRSGAYELGGPQILSFKELMAWILKETGRRRLLVPIPFWLARFNAAFAEWLPNPPITRDQVRLLEIDNVVSDEARRQRRDLEALGIEPTAIDSVVPFYMERFRAKGQFSRLPI
jgi:NADH dehydrogenase